MQNWTPTGHYNVTAEVVRVRLLELSRLYGREHVTRGFWQYQEQKRKFIQGIINHRRQEHLRPPSPSRLAHLLSYESRNHDPSQYLYQTPEDLPGQGEIWEDLWRTEISDSFHHFHETTHIQDVTRTVRPRRVSLIFRTNSAWGSRNTRRLRPSTTKALIELEKNSA